MPLVTTYLIERVYMSPMVWSINSFPRHFNDIALISGVSLAQTIGYYTAPSLVNYILGVVQMGVEGASIHVD